MALSYGFAAVMHVFHALRSHAQRKGMTDLARMRGQRWSDQLTCRDGAPKTRH
jgi:hypothetical protein